MSEVLAAAIYARISKDDEGTRAGVNRQLQDCRNMGAQLGWTVAEEYVDNDLSAYTGRYRPDFERMLSDFAEGSRDGFLCYHIDRLTREPKHLERFIEVIDAAKVTNVHFITGDMNLGTGDGLLVARIQAAVAANASDASSRRIKRKFDEIAAAGKPHPGTSRPYGYEPDLVTVRPAEASVIRTLVARYLAGETVTSLTRWLNDEEIPAPRGGEWWTRSVTLVLRSPRIAGLRVHRGAVVGPASWDPIISAKDHERILARFAAEPSAGRRSPRRYLLSGLLRCGRCGETLLSASRKDKRRYICGGAPVHRGCGRLAVVADPVEQLIADAVLFRLDTPELIRAIAGSSPSDPEIAALSDQIAQDQDQLEELAMIYADRSITAAEWKAARDRIEQRLHNSQKRLANVSHTGPIASYIGKSNALCTEWATLSLDRQVAIIRAVLDHAIVAPKGPGTSTFDPARVTPIWRL